jgi:cysteinyl-tRNA synthetase
MFVCGPTVYDYIHIGNARTFVVFDVIAKYLRYRGYGVNYIQNITDIDDKIIARAQKDDVPAEEIAEKFERIFLKDMKALKVTAVDEYPRATDYIPEIIKQAETLIEKGNAYLIEDDGYYFDLKTFPEYGKLSGRTAEMAEDAVSRIDESPRKRNRGDFCLWKFSKEGEPSWPADFGAGRPGWHIEDTAITEKYFGPQYEIHGGGQDLIFPHHEAEIAQQESASGLKPFVKYWLHVGFLVNKGGKMSKSLGNFLTIEKVLEKYSPEALRFYFLSAHYRSPLDYTEENLKQAEAAITRIAEFKNRLRFYDQNSKPINIDDAKEIEKMHDEIFEAMNDDFNTPKAIGVLFDLIHKINNLIDKNISVSQLTPPIAALGLFDSVFGVVGGEVKIAKEVQKLIDEREVARKEGDFARADELREQIKNLGYEVEDTIYGPLVKKLHNAIVTN